MSLSWNSQLLDSHIAPGISTFTRATIPDMAGKFPEADHWVFNSFLIHVFPPYHVDNHRQLVLGFLRRAQLAVGAYIDARELTLKYLDGNDPDNPRIGAYYAAVARWENFAIESSIAMDILQHIEGAEKPFNKGDGSPEWRLHYLANKVKHIGDDINKGRYSLADSVALWLSEATLNGMDVQVTYVEASRFLEDIAKVADNLSKVR